MCKDVERCFGVLKARFAIVKNPSRQWSMEIINNIMQTCCILYNMIVENEEGISELEDILEDLHEQNLPFQRDLTFDELATKTIDVQNKDIYYSLKGDPIAYLCEEKELA